jgi:hypothetical protein
VARAATDLRKVPGVEAVEELGRTGPDSLLTLGVRYDAAQVNPEQLAQAAKASLESDPANHRPVTIEDADAP